MTVDFLIVGAGLTGATIARTLTDSGHRVCVIDQRDHVGGNVHDHQRNGIRVHTYGPHYFRTNNERIWRFVNRFAEWWRYEPSLRSLVHGRLEHWPITSVYLAEHCPDWRPTFTGKPTNFEQACLAIMPEQVYEDFVKGYTEKQWGQPAHTLAAELAGRFHIQPPGETRLKTHRWQGIPTHGYTAFMEAVLDGIDVRVQTPYPAGPPASHVIYTGPIDAYHQHRLGRLRYRGQTRHHTWHPTVQQPVGQVNNPGPGAHIRTLEWVHMQPGVHKGSVITTETPGEGLEYPYPDATNAELYRRYRAIPTPGVTICGRLGEYRYYDMDQAIGRAFVIARQLLGSRTAA